MLANRALWERQRPFQARVLDEEAVVVAWEGRLFAGELRASSGERIEVVYPGRRNTDAGPDFHDAIIALEDGRLLHGDVEVHVKASGWRSHGHERDRRYGSVVLHVVMWDDLGEPTPLPGGATAPVLALHPFLKVPVGALLDERRQRPLWEEPCCGLLDRVGQEAMLRILDKAGHLRLMDKAAGFEAAVAERGPEQALYEGVMEALGYAKNREPFRQLAQHFPLTTLQGLLHGRRHGDAAQKAEALLLGMAGLLPSQRRGAPQDDYALSNPSMREARWREFGGAAWMAEEDWNLFRTRPENFPTRRIAGMARLVAGSLGDGFLDYFLGPLDQPALEGYRSLIARLVVGDEKSGDGPTRSRLIGRGRAMVIVANVILPYAVAYGDLSARPELADRARWVFFALRRLPSDVVVRQMSRQIFGVPSAPVVSSAARQQGLHHIYKQFCRWRRCGDCLMVG